MYGFIICLNICSFIFKSNALCSTTSNGTKRYGTDCKYNCHCINNEQCDAVTGDCSSGCDFEWVGPGCQFKNIAFKEDSRHTDNIHPPMYSDLANDNHTSTCSFTGTAGTTRTVAPWWTLWLPYSATFRKLVFVTKEKYLPYFSNFKLIVQNVSNSDFKSKVYSTDGVLCYQHDASITKETTVQVTCTSVPVGNLIRLQLANTSTQLVICDFRVYKGCESGFFGSDCREHCSSTCYPSGQFTCDNIEGACLNGCVAGWKGTQCGNECEHGKWGRDCAETCGNCFSATCNKTNGHCPNGCDAGFKLTDLCTEKCSNGYYGKNCKHQCSSTCSLSSGSVICDYINGTCLNGCKVGWKGLKCESECEDGKWGPGCAANCGNCYSATCNHVNGECPDGCAAGFKPTTLCTEMCNNGFYGKDCKHNCSRTCSLSGSVICDNIDGSCSNGCKDGWEGIQCEKKCEEGKWGNGCANKCGNCSFTTCNNENGECPNGCAWGFKSTKFCDKECDSGTYGVNCSSICSANCNSVCDKVKGTCSPCKAGWKGTNCITECEPGKWGISCAEDCGKCKNESACNRSNGTCFGGGCMPGYKLTERCDEECDVGTYGVACKQNCSESCAEICSIFDGKCGRCHTGWTGDLCALQVTKPPDDSSPVASVAGGISGAVVVAIIAVGLVLFVKLRRKQQKPLVNNDAEFSHALNDENPELINEQPDSGNIYVNSSNLHNVKETPNKSQGLSSDDQEQESDYYNAQSRHEVLLSELESYVKTGLANKEYFITQFKQIPYGMQYPANVATKPGHYGKNRYKSMYAYDHSRVILKALPDLPDSDYINATYIMGCSGGNDYIAAQGPISNTLEDFWRMIWEQNIKTVVMATNLSEEGKMKCIQYWPEAGKSVRAVSMQY
ncbi:platelet endothelial aggregation receptor 1-like [Mercenaria mercenaria]|uniref:platelet endothelial aggregation receptor 1-like n=1 Tax=Mercenaria mercenaria TaxID=6596 RepID=UPI00234E73F6|nr:platelet endothelial aggregation receptor 1-like [Mercenaria mercenaria]